MADSSSSCPRAEHRRAFPHDRFSGIFRVKLRLYAGAFKKFKKTALYVTISGTGIKASKYGVGERALSRKDGYGGGQWITEKVCNGRLKEG